MHEVWAHAQLAARKRWVEVDTPAGPVPGAAAAGRVRPRMRRRGWTPVRRWASTRTRSCASWATRRGDRRSARRESDLMTGANRGRRRPRRHPTATLARFASDLRFDDIPAAVVRRAEDLLLDWVGSALAGKGARAVETIERFARQMGPADGPSEVLISRRRTSPALRGDGQCRRLALRRAGRRAQRLGVPSGRGGLPAGARRRAGARGFRSRPADRRGRRLRSRHSRRRISRPLALQGLPHDRHRGDARRGSRARPAARLSPPRCCTPSAPRARRPPDSGSSCATPPIRSSCIRRRPRPTVSSPRISRATALPARSASSKARRGWRPACRPTPIRRASPTASATLGARGDVVQVPRVLPAHASRRRRAAAVVTDHDLSRERHRARDRARASGGDRCAGPGHRPATVHQAKFSMGTVLAIDRDLPPRRARRIRAAFPRSARRRFPRPRADGARRRGRCRLSAALDRQGNVETVDGRTLSGGRRAEGRSGQYVVARRARREGAASCRVQRRRHAR